MVKALGLPPAREAPKRIRTDGPQSRDIPAGDHGPLAAMAAAICWSIAARADAITAQALAGIASPMICRCGHSAGGWSAPDADILAPTCGRIGRPTSTSGAYNLRSG